MSILVKDMEMPDISDGNGISLCLFRTFGGKLRMRNNETGDVFDVYEVPPHGRLIDADEIVKFSVRIIDQAHRFNPGGTTRTEKDLLAAAIAKWGGVTDLTIIDKDSRVEDR